MKTSQIVIAMYLLLTISIYGQKEGNIWYFGNKAGLDFNSGSPVALTNGQMNAFEGCATISDSQGNLLFYTDGIFVWDKTHNQMPNGYGLFGNPSASQSGVIVPAPGSNTIYYIFSVPAFATGGFYYSVADLSLNGGLGDITQKNIPLLPLVSEKVTAILHQNGNDIWIITHGMNDLYYAYLLSVSGLNPIPVESVGIYDLGYSGCGNSQGYLKASPDGKLLAMAISFCSTSGRIELAEFDNQSGIITPFLTDNISGAYGVEFSPNCKLLYVSGWYCLDNLYQYRLDAGTTADILASKTMIAAPSIICDFSALQIGPDKKVYVGNQDYSYISVIHNPDDTGAACNFELNAISLSGKYCRLGLPTFIQSYFVPGFNVINVCFNDTAWFHYTDSIVCDSLQWCFGDSASGNNYSSTTDAFHIYSAPGIYTVTLHVFSDGIAHESYQEILIGTIPVLTGFHDTIICAGTSYIPDICSFNADSYLWNTGDTLPVITAQQEGTYVLDAYNECGNACDSFMVGFNYPPEIIFPEDSFFCSGAGLYLSAFYEGAGYFWNNGYVDSEIYIDSPGLFAVTIYNECGSSHYSVDVGEIYQPVLDLGPDTVVCYGELIHIEPVQDNWTFTWSDGSNLEYIDIDAGGLFSLTVTNACGSDTDTIRISHDHDPSFPSPTDTTFCKGTELLLDVKFPRSHYIWSDGSKNHALTVTEPGEYIVNIYNSCGIHSVMFNVDEIICNPTLPNIITPDDNGQNECFFVLGLDYEIWALDIFNRWGSVVYHENNYRNQWSTKSITPGVYYYALSGKESGRIFTGFFHVMK